MLSYRLAETPKIILLVLLALLSYPLVSRGDYIYYSVKKGDTFYSLSRKFNIEIWVIQKENNISVLKEGVVIKIPNRNTLKYTVKQKDTLFSIARRFNTTIEEIISVNKLESIDIKVGQILVIPTPNKVSSSYRQQTADNNVYTVKKGDTLFSISRNTGVDVKTIMKLNRLNSKSILRPGMIIVLGNDITSKVRLDNNSRNQVKNVEMKFQLPVSIIGSVKNFSDKYLEIFSPRFDKIRAVMDGEVVFVGSFSIFGKTVILKHSDGVYTVYGMFDNVEVERGSMVRKGQQLGSPLFDTRTNLYLSKFSFIINDRMMIPKGIISTLVARHNNQNGYR